MHPNADKLRDISAKKSAKRQEKKDAIALSAIEALKALGYANTTLRDIAANSDLSLGMLHYYFEDKTQLVIHCVHMYKVGFIADIDAAIAAADDGAAFAEVFAGGLADAVVDNWAHHRLWYDIRAQAMFDESFRNAVNGIEAELIAVLARAAVRFESPADVELGYAALDGLFRYFTQGCAMGAPRPRAEIAAAFARLLARLAG